MIVILYYMTIYLNIVRLSIIDIVGKGKNQEEDNQEHLHCICQEPEDEL
jgi:hypothetical protein